MRINLQMRCDAKWMPQGRTDEREPKQLYAIYAVVTTTPSIETTTVQPPNHPHKNKLRVRWRRLCSKQLVKIIRIECLKPSSCLARFLGLFISWHKVFFLFRHCTFAISRGEWGRRDWKTTSQRYTDKFSFIAVLGPKSFIAPREGKGNAFQMLTKYTKIKKLPTKELVLHWRNVFDQKKKKKPAQLN